MNLIERTNIELLSNRLQIIEEWLLSHPLLESDITDILRDRAILTVRINNYYLLNKK